MASERGGAIIREACLFIGMDWKVQPKRVKAPYKKSGYEDLLEE